LKYKKPAQPENKDKAGEAYCLILSKYKFLMHTGKITPYHKWVSQQASRCGNLNCL